MDSQADVGDVCEVWNVDLRVKMGVGNPADHCIQPETMAMSGFQAAQNLLGKMRRPGSRCNLLHKLPPKLLVPPSFAAGLRQIPIAKCCNIAHEVFMQVAV